MGVPQDNIAGKKYGRLTAIRWVENKRHVTKSNRTIFHNYWEFECECGTRKVIRKSRVTTKKNPIVSCGCVRGESHWRGYQEISGSHWNSIKKSAALRGVEFSISIEYAWEVYEKQGRRCVLSGEPILFDERRRAMRWYKYTTASLDRIDSKKGYTRGNIQWVHKDLNAMRLDFPIQEFISWCRKVASYRPGD